MRASSEGLSATVRALVPIGQDYGVWPVGIHWISHTVFGTSHHCMDSIRNETRSFADVRTLCRTGEAAMERAYNPAAIPCGTCVRERSGGHLSVANSRFVA